MKITTQHRMSSQMLDDVNQSMNNVDEYIVNELISATSAELFKRNIFEVEKTTDEVTDDIIYSISSTMLTTKQTNILLSFINDVKNDYPEYAENAEKIIDFIKK